MDTTKFKVEYPRRCDNCTGNEESVCCGALIVNHDICSDCGEHTDCQCVECEYKQDEEN